MEGFNAVQQHLQHLRSQKQMAALLRVGHKVYRHQRHRQQWFGSLIHAVLDGSADYAARQQRRLLGRVLGTHHTH